MANIFEKMLHSSNRRVAPICFNRSYSVTSRDHGDALPVGVIFPFKTNANCVRMLALFVTASRVPPAKLADERGMGTNDQ